MSERATAIELFVARSDICGFCAPMKPAGADTCTVGARVSVWVSRPNAIRHAQCPRLTAPWPWSAMPPPARLRRVQAGPARRQPERRPLAKRCCRWSRLSCGRGLDGGSSRCCPAESSGLYACNTRMPAATELAGGPGSDTAAELTEQNFASVRTRLLWMHGYGRSGGSAHAARRAFDREPHRLGAFSDGGCYPFD